MNDAKPTCVLDYFKNLKDPRFDRKKLYPLDEVLLVVLCGRC